jgi:tetratricopeptide (TPR) repeat protein
MIITPLPITEAGEGDKIVFSRIVRATVGQIIEIPFRGIGWVYLGEMGNRRGLSYDSRRLDIEPGVRGSAGTVVGQSFIFTADAAGTYILKFYKQDFIQDYIINDHVQVIVGEVADNSAAGRFGYPVDRGRVVAEPRWPPVEEPVAASSPSVAPEPAPGITARPRQTVPDEGIVMIAPPQASTGAGTDTPESMQPSEYVRRAKLEFDAGRIEQGLSILDAMKLRFPLLTDEALWLYGQLLEANSSVRDIRLALEYYRRLVREYPQSNRVADAERRIAYLERFYFNIR